MDSAKQEMAGGIMIPLFKVHHPVGVGQKIEELFQGGMITEGEKSDTFERMIAEYVSNENTSLVNSCTSALTLAYNSIGLGPGDEVITSPMTCMATNEPIFQTGAKIVWADIDPTTGNICPEDVKRKINNKTKAIVAVHWAGQPFDIDSISSIAKENNLKVVEDAAHALGAKYNGAPIGGHSDFVCFSFQAIKHLTTADGGAICSKNEEDDKRIKKLRWFGLDRKYKGSKWEQDISEPGYKFHMNNLNAVIGIEQMKYIENLVSSHKENARFYDEGIENKNITKLRRPENAESSHWIYTLLAEDREGFKNYLQNNGIASDVVHVRNDRYSLFSGHESDLPGCDEFCSKMINIPVGWWLTGEQTQHIKNTVNNWK